MKSKKEVLASFYDHKGFMYELVNEKKKRFFDKEENAIKEIRLYQGKELVQPWEVDKRNIDLSRSTEAEVIMLVEEYLKSSVNIKSCLQSTLFPFGAIMAVWKGVYASNQILKETLLKYQDVLRFPDFITSLTHEEKWVALTQNEHRTNDLMEKYSDTFEEMVSDFLEYYLSKENIESHELLYGEWRALIQTTAQEFYSDAVLGDALERAIVKTERDISEKEKELALIQSRIAEKDEAYERATISEKLKMESDMKELLRDELDKASEIQDRNEKINRIKNFFTQGYLPLSGFN